MAFVVSVSGVRSARTQTVCSAKKGDEAKVSRADFLKLAGGLTAAGIASAFPSAALAKKMVEIEDDDEEEEGGGLFGGVTKMFRKKPAKRSAQQDPSDVPQQVYAVHRQCNDSVQI